MPIHSVVGYRITSILFKEEYSEIKSSFKEASEFIEKCKKDVSRKADDKDISPITHFGVSNSPDVFTKINALSEARELSGRINSVHRNAGQRFEINKEADVRDEFSKNKIPVAAGPSSHTGALFTAAILYEKIFVDDEKLIQDMLNEYALAYFSYFATAGYHTFHEVMPVAALCLNINHSMTDYLTNIRSIKVKQFILDKELDSLSANQQQESLIKFSIFSPAASSSLNEGESSPHSSKTWVFDN